MTRLNHQIKIQEIEEYYSNKMPQLEMDKGNIKTKSLDKKFFKEYNGDLNNATPGMLIRTGLNIYSDVIIQNCGEGIIETFYSIGNYENGTYGTRKMKKISEGFEILDNKLLSANVELKIDKRIETAKKWAYLSQRFQVLGR